MSQIHHPLNYSKGAPHVSKKPLSNRAIKRILRGKVRRFVPREMLPCMMHTATGCCAYENRCTFLHDPRVFIPDLAGYNLTMKKLKKDMIGTLFHRRSATRSMAKNHQLPSHHDKRGLEVDVVEEDDASLEDNDDELSAYCHSPDNSMLLASHQDKTRQGSPTSVANISLGSPTLYSAQAGSCNMSTGPSDVFFFNSIFVNDAYDFNISCYDIAGQGQAANRVRDFNREYSMWAHMVQAVNPQAEMFPHQDLNFMDCYQTRTMYTRKPRLPVFYHLSQGFCL